MKKSLVALAALAVAGVASAQSSVTLFGIVDASVSGTTSNYINGGKVSTTRLDNSGYNSSRLGFRGTEDLGGGLAASFWLEAGLGNDTGEAGSVANVNGARTSTGQLFNRRSTVSLSGGFGEIRLGRDYKPTFWNNTVFDPFGTNGQGTNVLQNVVSVIAGTGGLGFESDNVRHSNTVGYFLPSNLGGFYGQVQYGFDEKAKYSGVNPPAGADTRSGDYLGGRIGYANGPFDIAFAAGQGTAASDYYTGRDVTATVYNLGASWDFGFMKLFGEYGKYEAAVDYDPAYIASAEGGAQGGLLGVTVPVGPGLIRASYSYAELTDYQNFPVVPAYANRPSAQKVALGYVHNLSKRTALYGTVAYVENSDRMPLGVNGREVGVDNSWGYDFGIRHSF